MGAVYFKRHTVRLLRTPAQTMQGEAGSAGNTFGFNLPCPGLEVFRRGYREVHRAVVIKDCGSPVAAKGGKRGTKGA